jgi:hypothetical protein
MKHTTKFLPVIILGVAIGTLIALGVSYLIARNSIQQQASNNKLLGLLVG